MLLVAPITFAQDGVVFKSNEAAAINADAKMQVKAPGAAEGAMKADPKATVALTARIEKGQAKATEEIDRRITALNELNTRIQAMTKVNDQEKANISAFLQSQVGLMASLKAKIVADADIDTLKTDIKSITESYRVFALVMPQGHMIAVTDAIVATSDSLNILAAKLQARIDAVPAGKDTTTLATLIADMKAKADDSKVQAQAAVNLIAPLTPDNGDKTIMEKNKKAFVDAKAKIKLGSDDIKKSREDAKKIVDMLKKIKVNVTATSTTQVQ